MKIAILRTLQFIYDKFSLSVSKMYVKISFENEIVNSNSLYNFQYMHYLYQPKLYLHPEELFLIFSLWTDSCVVEAMR
jgi:hypothetical protein